MASSLRHIGGGQFVLGGRHTGPDYSHPSTATSLGWSIQRVQKRHGEIVVLRRVIDTKTNCRHSHTDGSVDCRECGVRAIEFITAAAEFLHEKAE
jgi:hypothetical protein